MSHCQRQNTNILKNWETKEEANADFTDINLKEKMILLKCWFDRGTEKTDTSRNIPYSPSVHCCHFPVQSDKLWGLGIYRSTKWHCLLLLHSSLISGEKSFQSRSPTLQTAPLKLRPTWHHHVYNSCAYIMNMHKHTHPHMYIIYTMRNDKRAKGTVMSEKTMSIHELGKKSNKHAQTEGKNGGNSTKPVLHVFYVFQ